MALTVATNTGALMAQAAASSVNNQMETSPMQKPSSTITLENGLENGPDKKPTPMTTTGVLEQMLSEQSG